MISVWQRMKRVMGARAHANVDRLEEPEIMMDQLQRELVSAVTQARASVATATAWERRIADRLAAVTRDRDDARAAARAALGQDNEAMARAAMERSLAREAELEQLAGQGRQAARAVAQQRAQADKLRDDLNALKEKRVSLIQRERIARSLQMATGSSLDMAEPVSLVIERMEERVAMHEAAAEVCLDHETNAADAGLDRYLHDSAVDEALAALRGTIQTEGETR